MPADDMGHATPPEPDDTAHPVQAAAAVELPAGGSRPAVGKPVARSRNEAPLGGTRRSRWSGVAAWLVAWLALTAMLAAWRRDVWYSPPYWDAAMGLFVEANFLAETNFDYHTLATEEPRFERGGAAIYIISVLPTVVALLMTHCATISQALFAYHLVNFACAALIVLVVYSAVRSFAGRLASALAAGALLTTPLFSVQVDQLGMDLPMAAMGMLSAWLLWRERFAAAALAALGAFFCKLSGGVVAVASAAYLVMMVVALVSQATEARRRRYWLGLGLHLGVLAAAMATVVWVESLASSAPELFREEDKFRYGLESLRKQLFWCPDVVAISAVVLIGGSALVARRWWAGYQAQSGTALRRAWGSLAELVLARPAVLYSVTVVSGVTLAFAVLYAIPRYLILPLPFLSIALAAVLLGTPRRARWGVPLLAVLVAVNLVNRNGLLYPSIDFEQRTGAFLERSHEYLRDHLSNQRAVQYLAEHCADEPIICSLPMVHFLSLPRLGYVDEPLAGYAAAAFVTPTFRDIRRLPDDPPQQAVLVQVPNRFDGVRNAALVDPSAGEMLWTDDEPFPLVVFRVRVAAPEPAARANGWSALLWPESFRVRSWPEDVAVSRGEQLLAAGRDDEARELWSESVRYNRAYTDVGVRLAQLFLAHGYLADATYYFDQALLFDPRSVEAQIGLGNVREAQRRYDAADVRYERALALAPRSPLALNAVGQYHLRQGRVLQAADLFSAAIEAAPHDAQSHRLLGQALIRQGKAAEALGALERAVAADATSAELHEELARVLVEQNRPRDAARHFREALTLEPTRHTAAGGLAWLLATAADDELRNPTEALALAQQASDATDHRQPELLDALAAARAATGDFPGAASAARRAVQAALAARRERLAHEIEQRAKLYSQRQPYVQPAVAEPEATNGTDAEAVEP